jgi:hypothetical protein
MCFKRKNQGRIKVLHIGEGGKFEEIEENNGKGNSTATESTNYQ